MVLWLNTHKMNCIKKYCRHSISIRKAPGSTLLKFISVLDARVEFQSDFQNLNFGPFWTIFKNTLEFIPLEPGLFLSLSLSCWSPIWYKNDHNYVFYDFFVIIENLRFGDFFRPYRKRDEPQIGSDDFKSSIGMPSLIWLIQ